MWEYDVIYDRRLHSLIERISKKLNEGWALAGPFCAVIGTARLDYYQPMMRFTPSKSAAMPDQIIEFDKPITA